jgi:Ecdysteroid kinase-like family
MSNAADGRMCVTPVQLTEILRRKGVLTRGHVERIRTVRSSVRLESTVASLSIDYSGDVAPEAPARLFSKSWNSIASSDAPSAHSSGEMAFYNSIAEATPNAPVPLCYYAATSPATGRSHLLLEDLTPTHGHPPVPLQPDRAQCEAAVDSLARFHAHWWEHPRLGDGVGRLLDARDVADLANATAERFERFADAVGDELSPARRRVIERVIDSFPDPWLRLTNRRGLTLTHGDAHTRNILFPRTPGGHVYLVDWQLWHPHIGPRDLAFMMTLFWDPNRRAIMEQPMVRRHHRTLLEAGVQDYSWDRCWTDYRWSAIRNVFIPLIQWSRGLDATYWQPNFQRAVLAFDDLHCIELIER